MFALSGEAERHGSAANRATCRGDALQYCISDSDYCISYGFHLSGASVGSALSIYLAKGYDDQSCCTVHYSQKKVVRVREILQSVDRAGQEGRRRVDRMSPYVLLVARAAPLKSIIVALYSKN